MEVGLQFRPDPSPEEYGEVDPAKVATRTVEDLLDTGNAMERMSAAARLLQVSPELLQQRIENVPLRLRLHGHPRWVKEYPGAAKVALPAPAPLTMTLGDAVARRRSRKLFADAPITTMELSQLLQNCYGLTDKAVLRTREHPWHPYRAAPTSGGLSGTELYVLALKVDGVAPGLYHYDGLEHRLDTVFQGDAETQVTRCWLQPETLRNAACFFLFTVDLRRGAWKYHARYLHTALLDTGGILGYSMLAATALGLYGNPLTAFKSRPVEHLLKIDGVHEVPLVTAVFGRPGESSFFFPNPEGAP